MLSVYTRHHPDCAKKDDSTYRRCRCPKWLDGTLPGRNGRFRVSAKTKSWEKAVLVARKYENSALSGEDLKPAKMPTVKEAVGVFLADGEARGLAPATQRKADAICVQFHRSGWISLRVKYMRPTLIEHVGTLPS